MGPRLRLGTRILSPEVDDRPRMEVARFVLLEPGTGSANRHWRLTPLAGTANERSETVMPVCSKRLVRLSSVHVAVAGHGTPQQRSRSAGSFGMFALDDGEVESQLQLEGSGERLLPLQVVPLRRMLARG